MNLLSELIRTAPLIHREPGFGTVVSRLRYCLRGLVFAKATREWFEVFRDPRLAFIVFTHPGILEKMHRPYLTRSLRQRAALAALKQHYLLFVKSQFSDALIETVYRHQGMIIATLELEDVGRFLLRLSYQGRFHKEGELTVSLVDEERHCPIHFITFCVASFTADHRGLLIGGIQGGKHPGDKERIVAITRAMHGLRPKALVVFAVQELARQWRINSVRAVSDELHVYRHRRYGRFVRARYNELWTECGGQIAADGMFDLPVLPEERDLTDLKASKRQMYRRRHAMLRRLGEEIRAKLSAQ